MRPVLGDRDLAVGLVNILRKKPTRWSLVPGTSLKRDGSSADSESASVSSTAVCRSSPRSGFGFARGDQMGRGRNDHNQQSAHAETEAIPRTAVIAWPICCIALFGPVCPEFDSRRLGLLAIGRRA